MLLARLLNACHHFPGFVYAAVRLVEATSTIEVDVRARRGSKPHCSCCFQQCPDRCLQMWLQDVHSLCPLGVEGVESNVLLSPDQPALPA